MAVKIAKLALVRPKPSILNRINQGQVVARLSHETALASSRATRKTPASGAQANSKMIPLDRWLRQLPFAAAPNLGCDVRTKRRRRC